MAVTTTAFETELVAGGFSGRDRGLMAGAAYRLRHSYLDGITDPTAHTRSKTNLIQLEALTRTGKLASFDAITGP